MRIAFVNNTSIVSGAELSLLELIRALPAGIEPVVLAPPGDLLERARRDDLPVREMRGFESSFRLHPLHTSRGLASLTSSALRLRAVCRRGSIDVIHANTARAGLIASAARALGAPPVVTVIRDRLPAGRVGDLTRRGIGAGAAAVLANSGFTAESYGEPAEVVHPPVSLEGAGSAAGARFRREAGLPRDAPVVGIVGQITPAKGHDTLIRAIARAGEGLGDVVLAVVGEIKFDAPGVRHDNPGYRRHLTSLIAELSLQERVVFVGQRDDMGSVMSGLDLLALPSVAEPFGRVVVEAMLAGTAVVAAGIGGPTEVITDGTDGLLVPPEDPVAWADGLRRLISSPGERATIAAGGRRRAAAFSPEVHVEAMAAVYRRVSEAHGSGA